MEIVFVAITQTAGGVYYSGIPDAIKAAQARSGCRVWMISDRNFACSNFVPIADHWSTASDLINRTVAMDKAQWASPSLYRWCVVRDFAKAQAAEISWPILAIDYDVIVFSDLTKAYHPLLDYDWCTFTSMLPAAYSVHNQACLDAGVDSIFDMADKRTQVLNDMVTWANVFRNWKFVCGDLNEERDNGTFDPTMHNDQGRYELEPSPNKLWGPTTKRIVWQDGSPHFVRTTDNALIRAHWIHCWGSYKFRTADLLKKAGIK